MFIGKHIMANRFICFLFLICGLTCSQDSFAQEYTSQQVFDLLPSYTPQHLIFSPKGDIFMPIYSKKYQYNFFRSTNNGTSWTIIDTAEHETLMVNPITGTLFYEESYK